MGLKELEYTTCSYSFSYVRVCFLPHGSCGDTFLRHFVTLMLPLYSSWTCLGEKYHPLLFICDWLWENPPLTHKDRVRNEKNRP